MLTNLLHYEFKSTGRVVLPIAAGVLVLNIFTNILSHFVQNTSDRLPLAGVAMLTSAPRRFSVPTIPWALSYSPCSPSLR